MPRRDEPAADGLARDGPIRVLRVIARLNIGGPAIQALTLTRELESRGYATTLVRGVEAADEGDMDALAAELGVTPLRVPSLVRDPGWGDLRALISLVRILRRTRPQVVHTHAAKAGTLARVATLLAFPRRRRPVLIHTYHGHSLSGYFSARTSEIYRRVEQLLGRRTDVLVAVSDEVRDDLVALGVAPAGRFRVIELGFDLSSFVVSEELRGAARMALRTALRAELGIPEQAPVLMLVARLVPIKRVDRFLRVARQVAQAMEDARFVVVGDGELRGELTASADAIALGDRLVWCGFRSDMPAVYAAADAVIQTSDNEGTPVALIEAQAAGLPVLSTRVGGTATVVADARFLADVEDEAGLAARAQSLLADRALAAGVGASGRARVLARFGLPRLLDDIDSMYRALLEARA